jgi:hypothetical protein
MDLDGLEVIQLHILESLGHALNLLRGRDSLDARIE